MDDFIQISKLNDFLYSPKSLYFHTAFEDFDTQIYHDIPQTAGNIAHTNIDSGNYSSAKRFVQNLPIFCEKYGLIGKIDIYDQKDKKLIERKTLLKYLHTGYKYQLYGQYFCLLEMGYLVESLWIHSLKDNKRYKVEIPNDLEIKAFEEILYKIRHFDVVLESTNWQDDKKRDSNTIYQELYF